MNIDDLIQNLNPEIYERLKEAVELGKWANGERLTPEQRETCLQAVILYEQRLPEDERSGYIEQSCKTSSGAKDDDKIKWQ
ncbi:MAG: DUF1315 family protein [Pseudomonadota bacterium]|nr:DUF1315 family protein [Pseudomonadota bacterium]